MGPLATLMLRPRRNPAYTSGALPFLAHQVSCIFSHKTTKEATMTAPETGTTPQPLESIAELVRFAPDTFGFRYDNHVSLFIVTDEGVIVVDPCGQGNPQTPSMIKEAIRSQTDQPV